MKYSKSWLFLFFGLLLTVNPSYTATKKSFPSDKVRCLLRLHSYLYDVHVRPLNFDLGKTSKLYNKLESTLRKNLSKRQLECLKNYINIKTDRLLGKHTDTLDVRTITWTQLYHTELNEFAQNGITLNNF